MRNKFLKICEAALAAIFLCAGPGHAVAGGQLIYDNYLPVPFPAAYTSTFSVRADGIDWASAQIVITSATQVNQTFNDGTAAAGSLNVVSYAALSSATAHGSIMTISSDTALTGACISGGGGPGTVGSFNVCNPANFTVTGTTLTDCTAIAAAINAFGIIQSTCAVTPGNVITSTAPFPGSAWNTFVINSSTPAAISSATFSGGQDNQNFSIAGVTLQANRDFFPITSNAVTASAIVTAWGTSAGSNTVTLGTTGSVIGATATVVGPAGDYGMTSSSNAALSLTTLVSSTTAGVATGIMTGGTASSYTINGSVINLPGNGLGLAEGVWFSGASLSPLSANTTYFVIPSANGNSVQLSLTSTGAVAGLPIVFTSSAVKTTADTFTLNVDAITGTPGVQWMASNDNVNWQPYLVTPFNIAIGSVTLSSYVSSGTVTNTDFGHYNYGYIGLKVNAPTTGAINVKARVVGNAP